MDRISEKQIKEFVALQKQILSKIAEKYGTKVLKNRPKPARSFGDELERLLG